MTTLQGLVHLIKRIDAEGEAIPSCIWATIHEFSIKVHTIETLYSRVQITAVLQQ